MKLQLSSGIFYRVFVLMCVYVFFFAVAIVTVSEVFRYVPPFSFPFEMEQCTNYVRNFNDIEIEDYLFIHKLPDSIYIYALMVSERAAI